ncbi:hypothetical protein QUB60_25725 [Microcoleus sp. A2-C5]|uniref:hypothetical protein n=1 Tax=Microcoleaceae TaxID=1892252 RepID=UPI0022374841|nr:hypothetical protein [Lyngbya sp. CCAP 1446/10]MCW6051694.1 hypothetical protein [Lyngbya sp. CCAP 1446/10]
MFFKRQYPWRGSVSTIANPAGLISIVLCQESLCLNRSQYLSAGVVATAGGMSFGRSAKTRQLCPIELR